MLYRLAIMLSLATALLTGCGNETNPDIQKFYDTAVAKLQFSDMPWYDFGGRTVGSESFRSINLTNTGKNTASDLRGSFYLSVHFSFRGGNYPGTGGTCGEFLEPGAICSVVVSFAPQYAGTFEQPVTILFFDGVASQKAIGPYLRGEGI